VTAKREAVCVEIKATESELDAAVNAPVCGGRDPTEWLPDELMLMVLERVQFATLWSGVCERVCQRWAQLMESASIVRRKRNGRWVAYEAGMIKPRDSKATLTMCLRWQLHSTAECTLDRRTRPLTGVGLEKAARI
jgi:hypothetical protein